MLAFAAMPLIVPAVRLAVYAVHHGTMLGFLALQAETTAAGSIEIRGALDRWLYYPIPLWKSAPVLLPALRGAGLVWAARAMPVSQLVIGLVELALRRVLRPVGRLGRGGRVARSASCSPS